MRVQNKLWLFKIKLQKPGVEAEKFHLKSDFQIIYSSLFLFFLYSSQQLKVFVYNIHSSYAGCLKSAFETKAGNKQIEIIFGGQNEKISILHYIYTYLDHDDPFHHGVRLQ